jgi:hypothetical protein
VKKSIWTILFLLFIWEVFSQLPNQEPIDASIPKANYLFGIIHVHSRYSDGGGTVPEIAAAAEKAGMDFVVLTDHNSSQARKEGFEKNYGKVDLFVEMEASTHSGHLISFFSHTTARNLSDPELRDLAYKHYLGVDTRPGMFVITAHPSNIKNPWNNFDRFSEGLEVVNFDSSWQRQLSESVIDFTSTLASYAFNEYLSSLRFFQIYPNDLMSWDTMNSVTPGHFAVLAQDTHSKLKFSENFFFNWPTYEQTFKLASNAVYLKDPAEKDFEKRKAQIYQSIKEGKVAIVFQSVYPFNGNDWYVECGKKIYRMGETLSPSKDSCEFVIQTPKNFPYSKVLRLIKNGEVTKEVTTRSAEARLPLEGTGTFRLEVWAKPRTLFRLLLNRDVPYVLYNPIYVK